MINYLYYQGGGGQEYVAGQIKGGFLLLPASHECNYLFFLIIITMLLSLQVILNFMANLVILSPFPDKNLFFLEEI
jgi:hypothetical protein